MWVAVEQKLGSNLKCELLNTGIINTTWYIYVNWKQLPHSYIVGSVYHLVIHM